MPEHDPEQPRERRGDPGSRPRLGRQIARFNRRITNRLMRPLARSVPGFGVLGHVGRTSKRRYRTPVNAFRTGDGYVIALTYGRQSDWVRNVEAAGGCELETRGQVTRLTSPRLVHDPSVRLAPRLTRPVLRMLRVADFLLLESSGGTFDQTRL